MTAAVNAVTGTAGHGFFIVLAVALRHAYAAAAMLAGRGVDLGGGKCTDQNELAVLPRPPPGAQSQGRLSSHCPGPSQGCLQECAGPGGLQGVSLHVV
eukprot:CAMPEP_0202912912 /NCGR_PEP_ID=MMETSP1392-20130828/59017_1 /ASSEMBLY_ACC=CAM_ASM_000868 /TAXON_ID=225041 /ORGANISM="Chlamydomonas chlamydogama, Strain SAG 11-48b" /LENGTH=97 /DNA_ID=CAMNT_0049603993 /DNA_START=455 /DNA_END=743 /DNA_ORIENTATION=-